MNFVVAALIVGRFHDLSSLAASSELDEEEMLQRTPETLEEYVPNYEAEADIFWLFQVANFSISSTHHSHPSRFSHHINLTVASPQPSRVSLSLLGGQSLTGRAFVWPPFGLMVFLK